MQAEQQPVVVTIVSISALSRLFFMEQTAKFSNFVTTSRGSSFFTFFMQAAQRGVGGLYFTVGVMPIKSIFLCM
jgi:hypothetical protein